MKGNLKTTLKNTANAIKRLLNWKYFPFITAALLLAFYYLSLDLASIYLVCLTIIAIFALLDDVTPVIPQFLFMNVLVSEKNSPLKFGGTAGSDFYSRIENLAQIGVLAGLIIIAAVIRIILSAKDKKIKPTLPVISLALLASAFILNGVGADGYEINNLIYGTVLAFIVLGVYLAVAHNVKFSNENFIKIAYGFAAFAALLTVELAVKYITDFDKIVYDGYIHKNAVILGWGVWNNIGTFFAISIPPVCLLAAKHKFGYLFYIYAFLLAACAYLTGSRQAILGATIAFIACSAALIIKGRNRIINSVIFGAIALSLIITVSVLCEDFLSTVQRLLADVFGKDGEYLGNGRTRLMKLALAYFNSNPLFGRGFFAGFESFELVGITDKFLPTFAHNTVFEILGTCGLAGIITYAFHRVSTVIEFFRKPTQNKFYIAASILTLLLICLGDNYIFYLLPTLVYASALPFACGKEEN